MRAECSNALASLIPKNIQCTTLNIITIEQSNIVQGEEQETKGGYDLVQAKHPIAEKK